MKSFSSAYEYSREEVKSQRQAVIEQEHAEIVNAMKKNFGINSFASLNESERESYRAMLHKMWNKEEGLTEAGVKFINEANAPLTEKSTPEQIQNVLVAKIKANVNNIFSQAAAGSAKSAISEIFEEVKADAKKAGCKINKTDMFIALKTALTDEVKKRLLTF